MPAVVPVEGQRHQQQGQQAAGDNHGDAPGQTVGPEPVQVAASPGARATAHEATRAEKT